MSNLDYKKLVILLYYYSLYIFYSTRSELSKKYENGKTEFYINPNTIEPISTFIPNKENSNNDHGTHFNYNSGIGTIYNQDFNNSFLEEKGISFENYIELTNSLICNLNAKNYVNGKISKKEFYKTLMESNQIINIEKFKNECILAKENIESSENNMYKNNYKHRLDTTSIIDIGKIILYSKQRIFMEF